MHTLVVGGTGSGKSYLAKSLIRAIKRRGIKVMVLDPLLSPDWQSDFVTDSPERFLSVAKRSKNCCLVVDEAGQCVGRYNPAMEWCVTQSRHWGHFALIISQRPTQLSPTVRDQCERIYCFRVSGAAAKLLSDEFTQPGLAVAASLEKFQFIAATRYKCGEIAILRK